MDQIDLLFNQFIREQKILGKAPDTIKGYKYCFYSFRKQMPYLKLEEINVDRVIDFYEILRNKERIGRNKQIIKGVSNSTIWSYRNKLGSFFNWLKKRKFVDSNPFKETLAPRIIDYKRKYLKRKEIKKILFALEYSIQWKNSFVRKRNILIVLTALFAGLRKSEILKLKISDINLEKMYITIRGNTSKSKIDRTIAINSCLYQKLIDYLMEREQRQVKSEYLFISDIRDNRLTQYGLDHIIQKLIDKVGFHFHMHQFRHTFAVNLHYKGYDIYVIQKLLGHSDIRMTSQYLKRYPTERAKECINDLDIDKLI